ncbi:MAG: hypothetical protein QF922_10295, partial [SAR324 cluster bacterium]|nr:hypothetical protein [SAR324 cluster bacterium]
VESSGTSRELKPGSFGFPMRGARTSQMNPLRTLPPQHKLPLQARQRGAAHWRNSPVGTTPTA